MEDETREDKALHLHSNEIQFNMLPFLSHSHCRALSGLMPFMATLNQPTLSFAFHSTNSQTYTPYNVRYTNISYTETNKPTLKTKPENLVASRSKFAQTDKIDATSKTVAKNGPLLSV